ncbi:TIGR03086 family metal-binding protein [Kitasatospora kazusensis]|uniref:TIGR03086 family metal-binding protein n=1 Tax=Kitasatospora kazusensis TaxID=407974 RepID=A0ABN2Z3W6_9ACTN
MDIRALHARALVLATEVVDQVGPAQLDLPTPCEGWTLGRLLEHMIGANHGFAAAAQGLGGDLAQWRDRPFEGAPGADWATSVDEVAKTFADPVEQFLIPEIRVGAEFPAELAISFHYLDTLVHGWDVAAALGLPFEPAPELSRVLLAVAAKVPATPEYRAPGAQFGRVHAVDPAAPAFQQALALLGRDPGWAAPGGSPA